MSFFDSSSAMEAVLKYVRSHAALSAKALLKGMQAKVHP